MSLLTGKEADTAKWRNIASPVHSLLLKPFDTRDAHFADAALLSTARALPRALETTNAPWQEYDGSIQVLLNDRAKAPRK